MSDFSRTNTESNLFVGNIGNNYTEQSPNSPVKF